MEQTTATTVHDTPAVETREHPPLPASDKDLRWKQASRNPRFRLALIVGGIVLLVAGFFFWRYLGSYESTDDAQVDAHLNAISTRVSGHAQPSNPAPAPSAVPGSVNQNERRHVSFLRQMF